MRIAAKWIETKVLRRPICVVVGKMDFSSPTERLSEKRLLAAYDVYYSAAIEAAELATGVLYRFMGDEVVITFQQPSDALLKELACARALLDISAARLKWMNAEIRVSLVFEQTFAGVMSGAISTALALAREGELGKIVVNRRAGALISDRTSSGDIVLPQS